MSYQHAYHAGNLADLHKHALLAWMLDYLTAKPKPLSYLETHAGRGLYDLAAPESEKTGEARAGITRALAQDWLAGDHPLRRALADTRARHGASAIDSISANFWPLGDMASNRKSTRTWAERRSTRGMHNRIAQMIMKITTSPIQSRLKSARK